MSDTDNLEIKKQARRRIVGAAALALIAAIVLPSVMDGEPEQSGQDLDITLPSMDPLPRTQTDSQTLRSPVSPPVEVSSPATQTASAPTAPPAASTPTSPATTPSTSPATPVAPQTPPVTASRPAASSQPAPANGDGERARAILEGRAESQQVAAATSSKSYVLQVAAFKDAPRAENLNSELRKQGYKSFVEKEGDFSRVRIGPFATRAEAEKISAALRAAGRNTVLTAR